VPIISIGKAAISPKSVEPSKEPVRITQLWSQELARPRGVEFWLGFCLCDRMQTVTREHDKERTKTQLELLNSLVKTCIDSAEEYRRAAADVGKEKLVQFFKRQEAARRRDADELNLERAQMGGEAEKSGKESGSLGGFFDRSALDLSVVMSKGDTGVVDWCRQDVKDVIAEYEKALSQFNGSIRTKLERQLAENRETLAALEKVLRPYGMPRS
jgi:uncharacterized protein (TIGR02284 family)